MNAESRSGSREPGAEARTLREAPANGRDGAAEVEAAQAEMARAAAQAQVAQAAKAPVERREILRDYGPTRVLITVDVTPRKPRTRKAPKDAGRRRRREPRSGVPPWEVDPSQPRIVRLSGGPVTLSPTGAELPPKPKRPHRAGGGLWVGKPLLRRRGWTETAIRDFLPKPERLQRNPHPRGRNRPMPLWRPETVAKAEASPQWRDWLQDSLERRRTTLGDLSATAPQGDRAADERAVDDAAEDAVGAAVDAAVEARRKRVANRHR
ncbi:hypothetical protein [Glycomyces arizonensis]|uniref:hypothetical protein n=1 Tax=Glycomyces arizonensis TaxID=256035 RepID=UPI0012EBD723|nr:hypothetical protein [Glycomyces arizonensis]